MLEKAIQAQVCAFAKRCGVLPRKLDFGQGWPDVMFLYQGRVMFIEFKQPGKGPTPLQGHIHKRLRDQGFTVLTCNAVDMGKSIINWFTLPKWAPLVVHSLDNTTKETQ